jgi:hypothetical protein
MQPEITKLASTVLPWITTAVGWVVAAFQWRKKRKAEADLKLIRRRGDAPYFVPSESTFDRLLVGAARNQAAAASADTVLSVFNHEISKEAPTGTPVRLVVDNQGQPARRISVTLDGQQIQLRSEPSLEFASGLQFLEYPYAPEKHGKDQTLAISFESTSGVQDRHIYATKHGIRHLVRADPP